MEIVIQRFSLVAWRALNFSTVGYESEETRGKPATSLALFLASRALT